MLAKNSQKHFDMSGLTAGKKVADKRSVFDSDFIGREGRLNPRTVKEVTAALVLCSLLSAVFYVNFCYRAGKDSIGDQTTLADAGVLEKMVFVSSWERPSQIDGQIINPMLDANKILAYQQKYAEQLQQIAADTPVQKETPETAVQFTKIKIAVKGILWKPDGESMALIDRELLRENQAYKGYVVSKVLKNSVILSDQSGNRVVLNVGEDREIIATEITGAKL